MVGITHTKVATFADEVGKEVNKAEWNDTHVIDIDTITYAQIQNIVANNRLLGRISGAGGDIEELTGTQVTSLLDVFTDSLKGLVPLSGGGTTNFLRADGIWAAPSGGSPHTLLNGTTHSDTVLQTVSRGSLIVGKTATPVWDELVIGTVGQYLRSDGTDLLYSAILAGDLPSHTHTLSQILDVTMTVANLNSLDDGVNSTLHFHDSDRARANHTGTQLASTISDLTTVALTFLTGVKTFRDAILAIRNPADTSSYIIRSSAIAANRDVTIPLLTGADVFVTEAFIQTMTNKTMVLASNTITDTSAALGDLIKHNGTRYVRFAKGTLDQRVKVNSAGTDLEFFDEISTIEIVIDGGGSAITTGKKIQLPIDFDCVVTGWTIIGDVSGSIVVDINRSTYAGFPTTSTIAGSELPTLSSVQKNQDLSITTWTTLISAGDIIEAEVDSATTVTRVTVGIRVRKRG